MKKIMVLALLPLISISCLYRETNIYKRTYEIKNNSGYNLKLKFYTRRYSDNGVLYVFRYNEVFLENKKTYKSFTLRQSSPLTNNPNDEHPNSAFTSDSLVIIFNDTKMTVNTITGSFDNGITFSEPIEKNIFRHGNYTDLGNDTFQYTITQDDYENAEECNGSCD